MLCLVRLYKFTHCVKHLCGFNILKLMGIIVHINACPIICTVFFICENHVLFISEAFWKTLQISKETVVST